MQNIYTIVALALLIIIAGLFFFIKKKKPQENLSPFAALAFAFVIAGIVFGESGAVGYPLIGVGLLLAVIDMVRKFRK